MPCFYCSVDSFELKMFLICVIGGLAMCSILTFTGLWLKGRFDNTERLADSSILAENGEEAP